jgi:hypothetical protein
MPNQKQTDSENKKSQEPKGVMGKKESNEMGAQDAQPYQSSLAQTSNGEENTDSGRIGGQGVMNKETPSEEEEESVAAEETGSDSRQSRPTNR